MSSPCPNAKSESECNSESGSLEASPGSRDVVIVTNTKDLNCNKELHDIHQSNNVRNATQERLQESIEEPEMRDNGCQTRESLFDPVMGQPSFTTFGFRSDSGIIGTPCPKHNCLVMPAPPGWQTEPQSFLYPSNKTNSSCGYIGAGERYDSSNSSSVDPRYRAEAVIEMDQKRPFSIESTKSAPDVIATH